MKGIGNEEQGKEKGKGKGMGEDKHECGKVVDFCCTSSIFRWVSYLSTEEQQKAKHMFIFTVGIIITLRVKTA